MELRGHGGGVGVEHFRIFKERWGVGGGNVNATCGRVRTFSGWKSPIPGQVKLLSVLKSEPIDSWLAR